MKDVMALTAQWINAVNVLAGGTRCEKEPSQVTHCRSAGVLVAQWLECLTGVTEVVGSIRAWNSKICSVVSSSQIPTIVLSSSSYGHTDEKR